MANRAEISINLGLPEIPEIKDSALFGELFRVYNALRAVASTLDAYTGAIVPDQSEWEFIPLEESHRTANISRVFVVASEDISSGSVVNFHNVGGELRARNASAATGQIVQAFNAGGVEAGNTGMFFLPNCIHGGYSGLTTAAIYFLSTTSGAITETAPTVSGQLLQKVGYALSPNQLFFCPTLEFSLVPPPPPPPDPGG